MALILNGGTSNNPVIEGPSATSLSLKTSDTVALTIDSSQNVAITGSLSCQNVAIAGSLSFNHGQAAVTTGKAIAMAIVFG
jgi:hypothetical protein